MTPSFFVPLESEAEVSDQILSIWRTRSFLPTLVPTCCVQAAPGTRAQLPATGPVGEGGNCFYAKR